MKNAPKVSVVLAVYNGEQFLSFAVNSILHQTFGDFEFIIIDDASTDKTPEILNKYSDERIIIIRNKDNITQVPSLNIALERAQGEYIARMDADDISRLDRFSKQVRFLSENSNIAVVGSDAEIIDMKNRVVDYEPTLTHPDAISRSIAVYCPIFHPSVMMRRETVARLKGYDQNTSEDLDLWGRIIAEGEMLANIPEPLIKYRRNVEGLSVKRQTFYRNARKKIQNREWKRFGIDGPAPASEWGKVWPTNAGKRPNEPFLYGQLHLQFAKGYKLRGRYLLGLRHWMASLSWIPFQFHSYFYAFLFLLPYKTFERAELWVEFLSTKVRSARVL